MVERVGQETSSHIALGDIKLSQKKKKKKRRRRLSHRRTKFGNRLIEVQPTIPLKKILTNVLRDIS